MSCSCNPNCTKPYAPALKPITKFAGYITYLNCVKKKRGGSESMTRGKDKVTALGSLQFPRKCHTHTYTQLISRLPIPKQQRRLVESHESNFNSWTACPPAPHSCVCVCVCVCVRARARAHGRMKSLKKCRVAFCFGLVLSRPFLQPDFAPNT